jgi:hypothetical protein
MPIFTEILLLITSFSKAEYLDKLDVSGQLLLHKISRKVGVLMRLLL